MSEVAALKVSKVIEPIDKVGLAALAEKGKSNPASAVTLKTKTVCEAKFRNLNFIRNLPAHVIDEPPHLLGDDTAPNPSEAVLAALGSCLSVGLHANAVAQGISLSKIELELEGDINVTAVWGVGDLGDKRLGFTDVRVKVYLEGDATQEQLEQLVSHSNYWSPVANTLRTPVNVTVSLG